MRTRIEQEFCIAMGMAVRRLRIEKGIAQETLAMEAGIDRSHMGAIERGSHAPTFLTIARILPVLGVGFREFGQELDIELTRASRHRHGPPDQGRRNLALLAALIATWKTAQALTTSPC